MMDLSPEHQLFQDATESEVILDFSVESQAIAYVHKLHRWRKRNPEICTDSIRQVIVSRKGNRVLLSIPEMTRIK
jgi:hypothetical protein